MIKKFVILFLMFIWFPVLTFGQSINLPFAFSNELNVDFSPTYPRPNEDVLISLSLFSGDLSTAQISWHKNGRAVQNGTGLTTYFFRAGDVGERTEIEIRIQLLNGVSFSRRVDFTPASVDLIWEAESYTHPFYKGKALHPRQGFLKIVAMPEFVRNGNKISSERLVYNWSNGINVLQAQSGYGRSVLYIDGSLLGRVEEIEVIVTDPVNNLVARDRINISPVNPQIIFYENHPYYGYLFENALESRYDLGSEELEIIASPFFFSTRDMSDFVFDWRLNNNLVESIRNSMTAIFRRPEDAGRSQISLNISNPNRILQFANKNLNILFEN